ncbi:cadherin domain-containing protein [Spongiivirga sp. MCCC 1A20706]|uniref:cadherin domain-containing protein n=1 Tax=Spongiivirga sp. MCCC 1A20706 TaxID=3160963 RepID=UPI003977C453
MSQKTLLGKVLLLGAFLIVTSCGKDDDNPPPPMNNVPEIQAQSFDASEAIDENTVIGTVVAIDADNDALTFSIGTNSSNLFEITDDGAISLASGQTLDFETATSHTLTISVTDGTASANAQFTVNVTNVNEAPEINDETYSAAEDITDVTIIGQLAATDPENDTLIYSVTTDVDDLFEITNSGAISLQQGKILDFETKTSHVLTISVSDGSLNTSVDVTINVTDVNDSGSSGPIISDQSFTAPENIADNSIIGTVIATDPDGNTLTFSINTDTDALFEITNSGELSLLAREALDFETKTSHTLSINVSNGTDTSTADITINVTDANDNPMASNNQTFTVAEDIDETALIGQIVATDQDGDTLTYAITIDDDDLFTISSSGELRLQPNKILDFETKGLYEISVSISDGSDFIVVRVIINVTDENDAPEASAQTFTVAEDIDDSFLIGQIVATDQDGDALTFSFDLGNSTLFNISSSGELRLNSGQNLDFETQTSHQLSFFVTDGVASIVVNVTVNVTDVDENAGTVSRFAGNVNGIAGDIDGDALNDSALGNPSHIAIDSQGIIYVLNSDYSNVKRIDTNNQVTTLTFNRPSGVRRLIPAGLAVDSNDVLYVADSFSHVIYSWNSTTNDLTVFAGELNTAGFTNGNSGTFNRPAGIDFDPNDNLIVADVGNHSIRIVGPTGFINTIANTSGQSGFQDSFTSSSFFNNPVDVAVDSNGKIYVADRGNHLIRSVEKVNTTNWRIRTVAGDTSNLTADFADGNGTAARFNEPAALALDGNDIIYVADSGNNTIRKITSNSDVTTLTAGNQAGAANGPLSTASFSRPAGIEVNASGNLYVGDTRNNQVRFIQF